jgi:molybdopterin converting factor small subunit
MIRVVLPANLRALAQLQERELRVQVGDRATLGAVLDALEADHPSLKGTIRDYETRRRRPMVRFYACKEDWSDEPPDAVLPDAVASGAEPLLIVGAMSGG